MSNSKVIPQFVAVNINPVPDNPTLVSCQIIDRELRETAGAPCVDVLAISPETLALWDRIQHEASLYRSLVKQINDLPKGRLVKPEDIVKTWDELK